MARGDMNGPFGNFRGRVGNLVFYVNKGQNVVRSIGVRTKPYSPTELSIQQDIAIVNKFLKPIKRHYTLGFELEAAGTKANAYNLAIKYNKKHITGTYPNRYIDPSSALVTKGNLPVTADISFRATPEGVAFSWDPTVLPEGCRLDDQLMILFYACKESKYYCTFSSFAGAKRSAGYEHIDLIPFLRKKNLSIYVSFISDNRKRISDSVYLGEINVEANQATLEEEID